MNPVVLFDLQTTGLDATCHVTQLAAKQGRREFNVYVMPNRPISSGAQWITGMMWDGIDLFVSGRRVCAKPLYDALLEFFNFLRKCGGDDQVILMAHNCLRFDRYHLLRAASWMGLRYDLDEVCCGFADSLPLIREAQPDLNLSMPGAYTLEGLATRFLGFELGLHNALSNVRVLADLVNELQINDKDIVDSTLYHDDLY